MVKVETWRFIDCSHLDPAINMAIDEAILIAHSTGEVPPTIRFYGWRPPTVSIGYFQHIHKDIDLQAIQRHGLGLVRRMTGGRAVLHADELTYSVIVDEDHPAIPSAVTEAYRIISQGLLSGFQSLGLDAYFSTPETAAHQEALINPKSAVCFDTPSWYELVVEGRKVAGSAQTRQKGVVLQHGSILIEIDEDKLFDVFRFPSERVKQKIKSSFSNKAVAINQLRAQKVTIEEVKQAFKAGFEQGFDIILQEGQLSKREYQLVEELVCTKYAHDDWTFRK